MTLHLRDDLREAVAAAIKADIERQTHVIRTVIGRQNVFSIDLDEGELADAALRAVHEHEQDEYDRVMRTMFRFDIGAPKDESIQGGCGP